MYCFVWLAVSFIITKISNWGRRSCQGCLSSIEFNSVLQGPNTTKTAKQNLERMALGTNTILLLFPSFCNYRDVANKMLDG